MNKLCVCVVLSVLLVVASQVRATPERALTKAESWSAYGGAVSMCLEGMGRCYVDPANSDCTAYGNYEDCTNTSIQVSLVSATCKDNGLYYSNCTEQGDQVKCIKTTTCVWANPNDYNPGSCVDNSTWTYVGLTRGPQLGATGDDCNNPPSPPPEEYNY